MLMSAKGNARCVITVVRFCPVGHFRDAVRVVLFVLVGIAGVTHLHAQMISSDKNPGLDTEAVAPQRFIAAHGRKAAILGYAADGLEVWAYPFQVLSGYQVAFREEGATSATAGETILRRVTYEPDSIVRTYIGPHFVVRETLFVPLDRPGAILSYKVESQHRIDIEVHATPVLNLMWPAALGGQSAAWNQTASSFILTAPSEGISAAVGSTDIIAHDALENTTTQGGRGARIGFTLTTDRSGVARVFVALNAPRAPDISATLRGLRDDREKLESEFKQHIAQFRGDVLRVDTPEERVNEAIAWSELALDQAWVCNPVLGCGFVAGYGPSRGERRPQYDWFFAGDGLIAADAATSMGDVVHARQELEFILHYQDKKNGMIWHELSLSAGYLDWVGKYPYMFVHVDITFQFLTTLARYVRTTGDIAFVREHWPDIESAYRYCRGVIDPATDLPRIPSDKSGGNEQDRMLDDLGLSVSWAAAASGLADLAAEAGHATLAHQAEEDSQKARVAIPRRYWSEQHSFWISGHSVAGNAIAELRQGPSNAISMRMFDAQQSTQLLDRLASAPFQTDWGTRGVSADSPDFDPESYARGSVSAVGTAALAATFWSERRPVTAEETWRTLLPWTSLDSLGHIPEVLAGNVYRPQVESVPEQTWSSAAFLNATIHGLLGIEINAKDRRVRFAPRLPTTWDHLSIANLRAAGANLSFEVQRSNEEMDLQIANTGEPIDLELSPLLPLGADALTVEWDGKPLPAMIDNQVQETSAKITLNVPAGSSHVKLQWRGGVAVLINNHEPLLGAASKGIRIIDCALQGHVLSITADVPEDQISSLKIQTAWKLVSADGVSTTPGKHGVTDLTFAPGSGTAGSYRRAVAKITFQP